MGCCAAFWVFLVLVPQLFVTCFIIDNQSLPKQCVVPYNVNSFDTQIDLHFLLQVFNILTLSCSVLVIWVCLAGTRDASAIFKAICTVAVCIMFIVLIPVSLTAMRVLFENNPGCCKTLYGFLVLSYLILIAAVMCFLPFSMCYLITLCPSPHDPYP